MSASTQEWLVQIDGPEVGDRVDRTLARRMPFLSRTAIQGLLQAGRVRSFDNWRRQGQARTIHRPADRVQQGNLLEIHLDAAFVGANRPSKLTANGTANDTASVADLNAVDPPVLAAERIVFEDDHLLAVDKPSGVAVQPSKRHPSASLLEILHRLQNVRSEERGQGPESFATPCHRLDRETSGVVLFAKTKAARRSIGALFEGGDHGVQKRQEAVEAQKNRSGRHGEPHTAASAGADCSEQPKELTPSIEKRYLAVVQVTDGNIPAQATLSGFIGKDPHSSNPMRRRLCEQSGQGLRYAETHWHTLKQGNARALVEMRPITGRTHQLRVQAALLGCPILGDCLYFGSDPEDCDRRFKRSISGSLSDEDRRWLQSPRLALHAASLQFSHPITGERILIEAPVPGLFENLMDPGSCQE